MDIMKCDMGGSAAVVSAGSAISKAKLPIHVIGLIPATENRPVETLMYQVMLYICTTV